MEQIPALSMWLIFCFSSIATIITRRVGFLFAAIISGMLLLGAENLVQLLN